MAGLRCLKGNYYARIHFVENGKRKEKSIPLHTRSGAKANRLLPFIEEREKLFRRGIISLDEIELKDFPELKSLVFDFLEYLKTKGDSEKTLNLYSLALDSFCEIFKDKSLDLITANDYTYFVNEMRRRYPNRNTLNIRLRCCRAFLYWCMEFGKMEKLPFRIKQLKVDRKKPKYFSDREMEMIFRRIKETGNDELLARVKLHLNTGMRLRELHNAYLRHGFIHVYKSKGKKERAIPVDGETEFYFNWLKQNGKYTDGVISKMFLTVIRDLSLDRTQDGDKRHFHCLRHTFAVKTYYKTRDIYRVSKLLGHYSVTTTEIYAEFDIEQLERDFGNGKEYKPRPLNLDVKPIDFAEKGFIYAIRN